MHVLIWELSSLTKKVFLAPTLLLHKTKNTLVMSCRRHLSLWSYHITWLVIWRNILSQVEVLGCLLQLQQLLLHSFSLSIYNNFQCRAKEKNRDTLLQLYQKTNQPPTLPLYHYYHHTAFGSRNIFILSGYYTFPELWLWVRVNWQVRSI